MHESQIRGKPSNYKSLLNHSVKIVPISDPSPPGIANEKRKINPEKRSARNRDRIPSLCVHGCLPARDIC